MDCWRRIGVFDGVGALNVAGVMGIAAAGAAAAIAGIIYGALTSCVERNIVIGLACWFLFESGFFILAGGVAFRKAKEALGLRSENARLSTELHARRGRLPVDPPSGAASDGEASDELDAAGARDDDMALAVEALEANNRGLSAERVELRRRIRALEAETRQLASALKLATSAQGGRKLQAAGEGASLRASASSSEVDEV